MKSFHKTMGYLLGFFFIMTLVSIIVAASYINSNNLSLENIFSENTSINYTDHWDIDFFPNILSSNHRSDDYKTISLSNTQTFDLPDKIFISAAVEDIQFIEAERDSILVEYYRDQPDTKRYNSNFNTQLKNDQLSITTSLSIRNLIMTKEYKGIIKVYVPKGYFFEEVKLEADTIPLTDDNVYYNTNKLILMTDLGDIDLHFPKKMKDVSVFCDIGSISLQSESEIENIIIRNDLGDIHLDLDTVNSLDIDTDLGAINATLNLPSDTLIYADTDLGSIDSDFKKTNSEEEANYSFYSNLGSINIHQIK